MDDFLKSVNLVAFNDFITDMPELTDTEMINGELKYSFGEQYSVWIKKDGTVMERLPMNQIRVAVIAYCMSHYIFYYSNGYLHLN